MDRVGLVRVGQGSMVKHQGFGVTGAVVHEENISFERSLGDFVIYEYLFRVQGLESTSRVISSRLQGFGFR